jgi:hypothetical protein
MIKFIVMQFYSTFCNILSPNLKYLPQYPVLQYRLLLSEYKTKGNIRFVFIFNFTILDRWLEDKVLYIEWHQ